MAKESQSEKFIAAARELGADETADRFEAALRKMKVAEAKGPKHASDCAVHNAPAQEPGACDCGAEPKAGR